MSLCWFLLGVHICLHILLSPLSIHWKLWPFFDSLAWIWRLDFWQIFATIIVEQLKLWLIRLLSHEVCLKGIIMNAKYIAWQCQKMSKIKSNNESTIIIHCKMLTKLCISNLYSRFYFFGRIKFQANSLNLFIIA